MTRIFLLFTLTTTTAFVNAQLPYDVSLIPDSLKKNAQVVCRQEESSFEVSDVSKAVERIHSVFTVLSKEGEKHLFFYVYTNKFRSLDDCTIQVYDALGRPAGKFRKKDLIKKAQDEGLISEGNYQYLRVDAPSYPVTVELDYSLRYSGTMFYPDFGVQEDNESIQQRSFTLRVPKELGARFRERHIDLKPEMTEKDGQLVYVWKVANRKAFEPEAGSADGGDENPAILIAPNKFRIYNTNGDMSTWASFGLWESSLIKDLDALSPQRIAFFRELVKNASSEKEKIALVYTYLQNNFRYVSIQLGIGGYQPFPAAGTDEKKYGDCKGLSFFTYSVLKALGIRSHLALINAGYNNRPVDAAFPQSGFNHMILCIPQPHDSIWLECTSTTSDFNYLGTFTENRNALLITETGGVLVRTPVSNPSLSTLRVNTTIELSEDGSGRSNSNLHFTGDHRMFFQEILSADADGQKNFIVKDLGFTHPENFTLQRAGPQDMTLDLEMDKIPQFSAGPKMFLSPRIYWFWSDHLPKAEGRQQDYFFKNVDERTDSTIYHLPQGFTIDALPKDKKQECPYAAYQANYIYYPEKNEIVCLAKLTVYKNRVPMRDYSAVKSFFDGVSSSESQKLVIKKDQTAATASAP